MERPSFFPMTMNQTVIFTGLLLQLLACSVSSAEISLTSLLHEMTDREALARLPLPAFRLRDQSSYDRLSTTPQDAASWFANKDGSGFIRIEETAGRKEWVIFEHSKPGVLVRTWMPDQRLEPVAPEKRSGRTVQTILRIYLDGAAQPAIAGHKLDLFNGTGLVPYPFGHKSLSSAVSFLPIAYAKSCKITLDEAPVFYIIDFREYAESTAIKTFSRQELGAIRSLVERIGKTLLNPPEATGSRRIASDQQIPPKAEVALDLPDGGGALQTISLKLDPDAPPQVMRSLVLKIEFDGQQTVWCPVGDFFGSGVGLNPFQDWYRTVEAAGRMSCRWVMPYRKSGRISLQNLSAAPISIRVEAGVGAWTWDDRSMYFHVTWQRQSPINTRPPSDWNFVTLQGRGVYVGDTLTVWNPVPTWWGEGDAKIYVDDEAFPGLFGTGTEDYYGYSWGGRNCGVYQHPFHAQVRVGASNQLHRLEPTGKPATQGYSTETRTRALDTMPFSRSLRLDMEVWHVGAACEMDYAVATYWYGRPEVSCSHKPLPEAAAEAVK